ncbi:MAG: 16S rRNA (adenine(1518)-N(6)/adenine(1519)-N(6))-dimethyltransferase RsmA [Candidatus Neomarinimicrobiota bacterium]
MNPYSRKRWGQHFLSDRNLLLKLVRIIDPEPGDSIIEIGPGEGALTQLLVPKVKELIGVEIDGNLFDTLESNPAFARCTFLNRDFLEIDLSSLSLTGDRLRVVGNIPYNITSPVIFRLLEEPSRWWDIHLMVQKEVADRLTATPGGKVYGRLTVMVQAYMNVRQVLNVPPEVFIPKPRVRSAVVALKSHKRFDLDDHTASVLEETVRKAFSQRRKMLKNSLREILSDLKGDVDLDLSMRPEMLTVGDFIDLARRFSEARLQNMQ